MNERLIILSDLWGSKESVCYDEYAALLQQSFDICFYNCRELGSVDRSQNDEAYWHQQFINGGIKRAVQKLIELEPKPVKILAFSIGGTVAWKYGLATNNIVSLYALSATRLRKEIKQPIGDIHLYYGANDAYIPDQSWFDSKKLSYFTIPNADHDMYRKSVYQKIVCEAIHTGDVDVFPN